MENPKNRALLFLLIHFLVQDSEVVCAQTLLGNLPGNDATTTAIRGQENPATVTSKAVGFTTPEIGNFALGEVELRLEIQENANDPVVQIYDDAAGAPGSPLVTLVDPALPVSLGSFTFTTQPPLALLPDTTYWILVWNESPGADIFRWQASLPGEEPVGEATFVGYVFDFGPPPPSTPSSTFNVFEARGSAPPFFGDGFESSDTSAWSTTMP